VSVLNLSQGKREFASRVAEILLTRGLTMIIGFATSILLARILGPQGRGVFAVALTGSNSALQFCSLGIAPTVLFMTSSNIRAAASIPRLSWAGGLLLGGAGVLGMFGIYRLFPGLSPVQPGQNSSILLSAGLLIPVSVILLMLQNFLLGANRVREYNISELLSKAAILILSLAALGFGSISASTMMTMTLLGSVMALIYCQVRSAPQPVVSEDELYTFRNLGETVISFGVKVYLAGLLSFLVLKSDIFLIKHYLTDADAGQYSVAVTLSNLVYTLPAVVGTLLFTRMNTFADPVLKLRACVKALLMTFLLLLPITGFLMLLGEPILALLFGKSYIPAARALIWLMPGTLLLGLETVAVQFLASTGLPFSVNIWWALGLILNIGINIRAIPQYGISGAAVSSSLAYALVSLLVLFTSLNRVRHLGISLSNVFRTGSEKGADS